MRRLFFSRPHSQSSIVGTALITLRICLVLFLATAAHLWSGAGDVLAQASPEAVSAIPIGSRVRLVAPNSFRGHLVGSVLRTSPDTLLILGAEQWPTAVPLAAITQIELSAGRRYDRGTGRGAELGAIIGGLALGAMIWTGTEVCPMYETCLRNDPAGAAAGFVLGAIPGAMVGALVGRPRRWEEWRTLPLDDVRALSLAPGRFGAAISIP